MRRKYGKARAVERDELVEIGRVARPWGIRGEVKIQTTTDVPGRFQSLEGVYLDDGVADPEWYRIEGVKRLRRAVAVKFEKIDSPEAAERLRGFEVGIPESERAPLGEGEYYTYELVGLAVFDQEGERLGTLARVYRGAAHDVFEITMDDRIVLVPAVKAYVLEVDIEAGRTVLRLPVEGEPVGKAGDAHGETSGTSSGRTEGA